MRSRVEITVWLARLSAALTFAGSIIVLVRAGHRADGYMAKHPDLSRSTFLTLEYVVAAFSIVLAGLLLLAAQGLRAGRRWAWIVLLVIGSLSALGLLIRHPVVSLVLGLPTVAMFVLLLTKEVRFSVDPVARAIHARSRAD